uniref:Uncharacterized protein n=1 Tax=Rhizophora mucronata TaxID=61149 RepID=A0A2P2KD54_RHIMU
MENPNVKERHSSAGHHRHWLPQDRFLGHFQPLKP